MADVVSISGGKIDADDGARGLLTKLKDMVGLIEAGEMKAEKWLLLVERVTPNNLSTSITESFDSGITVSEAVYMMSGCIYDLHWKVRQDIP